MASVDVQVNLQLSQRQLNAVTRQIQSSLGNLSAKNLTTIDRELNKGAKSAQTFGDAIGLSARRFVAYTSAVAVVGRLSSALTRATRDAIKFEREFVKLAQVFDTSVKSLGSLSGEISNLSKEFGINANVIARTSVVLAQSGLSARDTEKALRSLAKTTLASTFEDIGKTAEGAVAILAQFGAGVGALESQLGSINAVAKKFAVESGDIIEAIRRAGGAFNAAGGNLEEFIALFTSVRSTTRESAETIATGFRTIFGRIQRPRTIEYFRRLNIELTDGQGNFIGAFEAIKRLSQGLEQAGIRVGSLKFAEVVEQLGGIRQISRVIPLITRFGKAQEALNVAQTGSASLTADVAKAQETLSQAFARTQENFSALIREISQSETFQSFVRIALSLANAFIEVARSLKPLIPLIGALGAIKLGGIASQAIKRAGSSGSVLQFARGGVVPGSGNGDTVPAMLEPGEFVIRKSAVQAFGAENLAGINKYASGGIAVTAAGRRQSSIRNRIFKDKKNQLENLRSGKAFNDDDEFVRNYTEEKIDYPKELRKGNFANNFEKFALKKKNAGDGGGKFGGNNPLDGISKNNRLFEVKTGRVSPSEIVGKIVAYELQNNGRVKGRTTSRVDKNIQTLSAKVLVPGNELPSQTPAKKKAKGGSISGTGTDTVPALLTPGEFVVNKKSAEAYGYGNLKKINKYAKGGVVQKFANGGDVSGDFSRGTGKVIGSIKEAQKTADEFVNSFGQFGEKIKEVLIGEIKDIKSYESEIRKSIKSASPEKAAQLTEKLERVKGARGVQRTSTSGRAQVSVRAGSATEQTVRHEVAHAVDVSLGGGQGKASQQEGTFQNEIVKKMKPILEAQLRSQGKSEKQIQYRLQEEEIFADLLANTTDEARKILTSTTDAAKGMKALADLSKKTGGTIAGFAGADKAAITQQNIAQIRAAGPSKAGATRDIIAGIRDQTGRAKQQKAVDLRRGVIEGTAEIKKRGEAKREAAREGLRNVFKVGGPSGPSGPSGSAADKVKKTAQDVSKAGDSMAIKFLAISTIFAQTGALETFGKLANRATSSLSSFLSGIVGGEDTAKKLVEGLSGVVTQLFIFTTALQTAGVDVLGTIKGSFSGSKTGRLLKGGFGAGSRAGSKAIKNLTEDRRKRFLGFGGLADVVGAGGAKGGALAARAGGGKVAQVLGKASGAIGGLASAASAAAVPLLLLTAGTLVAVKGIQVLADSVLGISDLQKGVDLSVAIGDIEGAAKAADELADAQQIAAGATIAGGITAGAALGATIGGIAGSVTGPLSFLTAGIGAAAGGLIGGLIGIVNNLDDFLYNTRAINIAAARTAAALNKTAIQARKNEARNKELFRAGGAEQINEAIEGIASEIKLAQQSVVEAKKFVEEAKKGKDEEKIQEATDKLTQAQESQSNALNRNRAEILELVKATAQQTRGSKTLDDVLASLPKNQREFVKALIESDKTINKGAASLELELQNAAAAGKELRIGFESFAKTLADLDAVVTGRFARESEVRQFTGQTTTRAQQEQNLSTRASLATQDLQDITKRLDLGDVQFDVSTAAGLSSLTRIIQETQNELDNLNNGAKETSGVFVDLTGSGKKEQVSRESADKYLKQAQEAQKRGIALAKEQANVIKQEIQSRLNAINATNNYIESFAFASNEQRRSINKTFGAAQKLAASGGDISSIRESQRGDVQSLLNQFKGTGLKIFDGKTSEEVLGDVRIQQFGGEEALRARFGENTEAADAAVKAIREGSLSEQDKLIQDLKQVNEAINNAELSNVQIFGSAVELFRDSVLFQQKTQAEKELEAAQQNVKTRTESVASKDKTILSQQKAKKDSAAQVEASKIELENLQKKLEEEKNRKSEEGLFSLTPGLKGKAGSGTRKEEVERLEGQIAKEQENIAEQKQRAVQADDAIQQRRNKIKRDIAEEEKLSEKEKNAKMAAVALEEQKSKPQQQTLSQSQEDMRYTGPARTQENSRTSTSLQPATQLAQRQAQPGVPSLEGGGALQASLDAFNISSSRLAEVLQNHSIPETITLDMGSPTVNVNLNGAEILSSLHESVDNLINNKIIHAFQIRKNKDNSGDTTPMTAEELVGQ